MFRNLLGFGEMLSHWRQRERQKTLQMHGLRLGPIRFPPACRPLHFEKPDDSAPHPDACSYDSRESAEAQFPLRKELEIAQQVHQKPGPDLPSDLDHRRGATRGGESGDLRRAPGGGAARMARIACAE